MPDDDRPYSPPDPPAAADAIDSFRIEELLGTSGDVRLYRARDENVDRRVLLHVAGEAGAVALLEDARRIAGVSHPGLVGVLGASRSESGGYAAVQDADARPLSEVGSLSSEQAARVAIDIAGAIGALAQAGLRARVDGATVLVAQTPAGVRGLLDPLRAMTRGQSSLAEADPAASTGELAGLLEQSVPEPGHVLRSAIDGVRSGVSSEPAQLARALAPLAAPRRTAARPRPALIAAACLALAVAAGAAVLVHERSDEASRPATAAPQAPAARIVARIPLGLPGDEQPLALIFLGRSAWIGTTAGRLLQVDTATNQLVGNPIKLSGRHPISALVASGGKLYTTDFVGWLLRIDPRTRAVTGRRHLSPFLGAMQVAGGVLWIASAEGSKGSVIRVDPKSLKPIGVPLEGVPEPRYIAVRGSRAWVLGASGQVTRVDVDSRKPKIVWTGPQTITARLAGETLWITDQYNGTVSALDTERMMFNRRALLAPRTARGVMAIGNDVWFTSSDALTSSGRLRLERFDIRSGRRAGTAVALGRTTDYAMTLALGSLWVLSSTDLIRLAPTLPRPAVAAHKRIGGPPYAFVPGPLPAATWRSTAFAVPVTFKTPAFEWLGVFPKRDALTLLAARERHAELDISTPRQVFVTDQTLRDVGDPAGLLAALRQNRRLLVGAVRHVAVGGRPALQFEVRANKPLPHPEVCGPRPCTLVFPLQDSTVALAGNDVVRLSLLRSAGHTIVISEGGQGDDRAALELTASLLRTFRFPA